METIKGYVDHIIFHNSDNGYTVMNFISSGDEVVCVGTFPDLAEGENLSLNGEYISHPTYGEQFKVSSYETILPTDRESMERYLRSGAVKGVGAALASRILRKFGDDTLRILEEEPERLSEIKGISPAKARDIGNQIENRKEQRDAILFLSGYGISPAMAYKIYDTYGMSLYMILRENPYRLAEDINGIGFKTADEIASRIGINTDSEFRIRSGIMYILFTATSEGNVYLPREMVVSQCAELLDLTEEAITPVIDNLVMDKKVVVKNKDQIFAANNYYAELSCARMLSDINSYVSSGEGMFNRDEEKVRARIRKLAESENLEFDELQEEAVYESVRNGVFILSGGPGTGKTTTINTIIKLFMEEGLDIFLAAPTGRAAKRMTEATGFEAKTIHRMLELNGAPEEGDRNLARFERNEDNPLEADVIIIDEMSMVDLPLFRALLRAITPGTRLIMVGDVNQLPSVGPGQILRDLIESERFPVVILQKIFRQAEVSDIVVNAHKINRGEAIALDNKSKDFFFLERNDTNVIYKHMIQLIRDKLPGYVGATPFDIQVLTPMRKGALGVETLNGILQEYLNPADESKKEHRTGDRLFREGDKVMQIKNNYKIEWEVRSKYNIPIDSGMGVFNGDIGTIKEINEYASTMEVEFDEGKIVTYPFSGLDELDLSYAITIHKSQGSEYPAVILPLLTGPRMLFNRNLLYTAITRAKNCVTILGSSETVRNMIDNETENKRYTALKDRIREVMP
ncbi:MAG: ATP-dependent RecD-like DNA helicase [Lachnospiraceae bacterium]|jgi:exodeoxyribonuclease V alpha subunit|nr:ATP-dependent RecD-like DNA helicase [Lachnospiraceae bacterium]